MIRSSSKRVASLLLVLLVGTLLYPRGSSATGGSTWKITFKNDTEWTARVKFAYMLGAGAYEDSQIYTVLPGTSYSYNVPGAHCPGGIKGTLLVDSGREVSIRSRNCLDTGDENWFSACCWNVTFGLCRVSEKYAWITNDDYQFCKK
jgi:hypothetical protein